MLNRLIQPKTLRAASLRFITGAARLLPGVALFAAPTSLDAAKRSHRDSGRNKDNDRDNSENRNDNDKVDRANSNGGKDRQETKRQETRAESKDDNNSSDKNDKSSNKSDDDDGGNNNDSHHQRSYEVAQKNNGGGGGGGGKDDEPAATPTPTPSGVTSTNPNVNVGTTTGGDDVELVVQSNPDVIANTSAKGGFAFAKSNGVTAISGPDGAKIIQSGTTETVEVPGTTTPTEPPTDGGDNTTDFAS